MGLESGHLGVMKNKIEEFGLEPYLGTWTLAELYAKKIK